MAECSLCKESALRLFDYAPGKCWSHADDDVKKELIDRLSAPSSTPILDSALRAYDFGDAVLRDLVFERGDFTAAQFRGALLINVTFRGLVLDGADFSGARLHNVRFVNVAGGRVDYTRALLTSCEFRAPEIAPQSSEFLQTFRQASFDRATLEDVVFEDLCLDESSFNAASLTRSSLNRCRAKDCDFRRLRADDVVAAASTFERSLFTDGVFVARPDIPLFKDVNFSGGDFRQVVITLPTQAVSAEDTPPVSEILAFTNCQLVNCDFTGAHINRCIFIDGDATSCSFSESGLARARFDGTELASSVFDDAYLDGTVFRGAPLPLSSARFVNAYLKNVRISGATAHAANFSAAKFDGGVIEGCQFAAGTFPQVVFERTRIRDVEFRDALMRSTSFVDCSWEGKVSFKDAQLSGGTLRAIRTTPKPHSAECPSVIDFSGADLSDTDFEQADLRGCLFHGAVIHGATLTRALLDQAKFDDARLTLCELLHLTVSGASFVGSRIVDCHLWGSHFDRCDFTRADLSGSTVEPKLAEPVEAGRKGSFAGCDLTAAQLSNCTLSTSDFRGACLTGAALRNADLRGAVLDDAEARGADFAFAKLGDPDLARAASLRGLRAQGAGFNGAQLNCCDCTSADFSEAHVEDCSFDDARLTGCRFDHAQMDGAKFARAEISGATFCGAHILGVAGFESARVDPSDARPADFSFSYIEATQAPLYGGAADWERFRDWLNKGQPKQRHLSWVAWKSNYQSLGLYAEQSECFREEQVANGFDGPSNHRRLRNPHRWPWLWHSALFGGVLFVLLLLSGLLYRLIDRTFDGAAELAVGSLAAGITAWAAFRLDHFASGRLQILILDVVYGFGERPGKVLLNGLLGVVAFAAMYWIALELEWGAFEERPMTPGVYVYFSGVALGYGDIKPFGFCRFLANVESAFGLVMSALFVFALARRTAGR